jgi:hypothetical protein
MNADRRTTGFDVNARANTCRSDETAKNIASQISRNRASYPVRIGGFYFGSSFVPVTSSVA